MAELIRNETTPESFFIRTGSVLQRVNVSDICWINSEGNYITINTLPGKKFVVKMSLKKIKEQLPEDLFIQIHRSVVVQVIYINKIDVATNEVIAQGNSLPLGRRFKSELLERLTLLQ